jgi:hypothetical protein
LKSPSEYPVRRLAVFGGYNHPEPAPTWRRVVKSEVRSLRPLEVPPELESIISFDAMARPAELYRAA